MTAYRPQAAACGMRRRWLALSLLTAMKPGHWQMVLDQLTCPTELLDLPASALKALGLPPSARRTITEQWQAGQDNGRFHQRLSQAEICLQEGKAGMLSWQDPHYPESLRHIHGPPPVLYVRGNPQVLTQPQIGIVGSRHASRDGLDHARCFARTLAEAGCVITSGLALGADAAAHRGALELGGVTIGVLATGVDRLYPRQHAELAMSMLAGGALVSEMPPGTPPTPDLFPRRNRILSGLCQGVLVVEASPRSGSLITARLALEQGREVFAIPGSINNPQARGCHQLIREGAVLVETVDDVLQELGVWDTVAKHSEVTAASESSATGHLDEREQRVMAALSYEPRSTDDLCNHAGLTADQLLQSLLLLEMESLVESSPAGYRKRAN